jgi:hypothetical protein
MTIHEITDLKSLENIKREQELSLEYQATISHQMLMPLKIISSVSNNLACFDDKNSQKKKIIRSSADQLYLNVSHQLDQIKLNRSEIVFDKQPFSITQIVSKSVSLVKV